MTKAEEKILALEMFAYIIANIVLYQINKANKGSKIFHAIASALDNIILIFTISLIVYKENPYMVILVPVVLVFIIYPITYIEYNDYINGNDDYNPFDLDEKWLERPKWAYKDFITNYILFPFYYLMKSWKQVFSKE